MRTFTSCVLLFLLVATGVFAQSATERTAPVEWTLYRDAGANAAVIMPKLPVRIDQNDICSDRLSANFLAYAGQAVYEFQITRKNGSKVKQCEEWKPFDESTLNSRMAELRMRAPASTSEKAGVVGGLNATKFRWEMPGLTAIRWVIPDMKNDRWLELAVSYRPDNPPDEKRFLDSLKLNSNEGVDVLTGSQQTIGDSQAELLNSPSPAPPDADPKASDGLVIRGKPRPSYTEISRSVNIQGTVILRVTFMADGSIGAVSPVKGLPYGLTEEAIAAVRRIVFLPMRINRNNVNVTKQVEYTFSIY